MFQKNKVKPQEIKTPKAMELNNLPDKELKAIVIKMLTKLRKIIEEHSEDFENILTCTQYA